MVRIHGFIQPEVDVMSSTGGITGSSAAGQAANAAPAAAATPSKQMFLQLLVAQIKNQDPLNPADGTQFLTQLAQFSQLEQSLAIAGDVAAIRQAVAAASPDGGSGADARN